MHLYTLAYNCTFVTFVSKQMFAHSGRICEDRASLALAQVNGSHKMLVCHANICTKAKKKIAKIQITVYTSLPNASTTKKFRLKYL